MVDIGMTLLLIQSMKNLYMSASEIRLKFTKKYSGGNS